MIYVDLKGNLGNQLFIYAFARKIQYITGQKIYFSTYNLEKYFPNYKCSLQEFIMNSNCEIGNKKLPTRINSNWVLFKIIRKILNSNIKLKIENKYFNIMKKKGYLYWQNKEFKKIDYETLKRFKNIYVSGFWQSEKYFKDIKNILIKELKPLEKLNEKNQKLYEIIKNRNSVCVSIRRGDYISNQNIAKQYFVCDEEYFKKSIELIKKFESDIVLILFSDDIDWVRNNIDFGIDTYYETGNDSLGQKVLLMSSCKNYVISNSSFSWWTQYLSPNANTIVAPSKWYIDGSGVDIYQDSWKLIEVGSNK